MSLHCNAKDRSGVRYGRLLALRPAGRAGTNLAWLCLCDCGKESVVSGGNLTRGKTKSCGCLNKERVRAANTTHGFSKERLFGIWKGILQRCTEPNFHHYRYYGGRGIVVCEDWMSFQCFRDWSLSSGYSDDLAIDRIDNDGDYTPQNCRWVTTKEQARNTTRNTFITFQGKTLCLAEWAERLGISASAISKRIGRGWSVEKALTDPLRGNNERLLTHEGSTRSIADWSRFLGINYQTLLHRLYRYGWTVERALSTPQRKWRRKK